MVNELKNHYDRKYFLNSQPSEKVFIQHVNYPSDRFEACVHYFHQCFRGGDILELGAGDGSMAMTLLSSGLKIDSYVASEFTQSGVVSLGNNLQQHNAQIIQLSAEEIPDNQIGRYDAVILLAVIEHLIDPLRAMQRIKSTLKPGGFVYLDTPNIAKFSRRIKLLFGRFPSTASKDEGLLTYENSLTDLYDEGHLHYFTFRSLSKMLLERCGFRSVVKFAYPSTKLFSQKVGCLIARFWPEMFSEIALGAFV